MKFANQPYANAYVFCCMSIHQSRRREDPLNRCIAIQFIDDPSRTFRVLSANKFIYFHAIGPNQVQEHQSELPHKCGPVPEAMTIDDNDRRQPSIRLSVRISSQRQHQHKQ